MNTEKITKFLDSASEAYYAGSPIISDAQFDKLAEQVGYGKVGAAGSGAKVPHLYQMYSLQKYYEGESVEPLVGVGRTTLTTKLDGAAVSLLYLDGVLVRALTRGDGKEGQDVTAKFLATKLVPHTIPVMGAVQITGELAAPLNIENARNYAAGALNLKDTAEFASRALSFIAYGVQPAPTDSYAKDMSTLGSWGFGHACESNLDIIFPSDGLVYRVDSNAKFYEMGYTAKHPRGAYAVKTRGDHVETKLLSVEWQVGKSGKVTPVAILEPVYIGDALVSRATLNNPGFIESLGIEIGDTVAVIRAGEIIPCITHKVEG